MDIEWLSAQVADDYNISLQKALDKLVADGKLAGKFIGDVFLPAQIPALQLENLERFFANLSPTRRWISCQEILPNLPELAVLEPVAAQALLTEALENASFVPLGGDRWTTIDQFDQMDREIYRGLPVPHVHSKIDIWTDEDEQDLAQVDQNSLPEEAREIIEIEESVSPRPESVETTWQAPSAPIKLPTLSYLHITQGYFPIYQFLKAFPPDSRLVFVQVIEGEHQPFLVDRHQGALKALDREWLGTTFLDRETSIPAGTYLWLEYQGGEKYRLAPRPLSGPHLVPCKHAFMEAGQLQIEHKLIPMFFEGDPAVFQADMRFSDIEALFAEAERCQLSVRDAIIQSIEELCESDPQDRAHRNDIFNTVFLKRMCSPNSVAVLLYTQPCFEQLGHGFFRYNPSLGSAVIKKKPLVRKRQDTRKARQAQARLAFARRVISKPPAGISPPQEIVSPPQYPSIEQAIPGFQDAQEISASLPEANLEPVMSTASAAVVEEQITPVDLQTDTTILIEPATESKEISVQPESEIESRAIEPAPEVSMPPSNLVEAAEVEPDGETIFPEAESEQVHNVLVDTTLVAASNEELGQVSQPQDVNGETDSPLVDTVITPQIEESTEPSTIAIVEELLSTVELSNKANDAPSEPITEPLASVRIEIETMEELAFPEKPQAQSDTGIPIDKQSKRPVRLWTLIRLILKDLWRMLWRK
ncbi:MAG: hypothetical protein JXB15_08660 [Anaerolineales bacterium]|nr:hypothetical protein [Anaerolineales bacterium]